MDGIKIKSGPADIIASGSLYTFLKNPISFEFEGYGLKMVLEFDDDEENDKPHSTFHPISNTEFKIMFYNFNSPNGTMSKAPLPLFEKNNEKVFIQLKISLHDEGIRHIEYTLFSVKME